MKFNSLRITAEPAAEPVTLQELKDHMKVTVADDDTIITAIGKAARKIAEVYTRRAFINTTFELILDDQPDAISLPGGCISTITSVKTVQEGGVATAELTSLYETQLGEDGKLWLKIGSSWTTTMRLLHLMEIVFVAGYGVAASAVPENIKLGIKMIAAWLYEHRGDITSQDVMDKMGDKKADAANVAFLSGASYVLDAYRIYGGY